MLLRLTVILALMASLFPGCNSSGKGGAGFCDTVCFRDSLKFILTEDSLRPYVYISAKNCNADTITWSYRGKGVDKKISLDEYLNTAVKLNPKFVKCKIYDTAYAWLMFNNCENGRGYLLRLPYAKATTIVKSSAINNLDPKFSVPEDLACYTDRGNIFVEDMATGKTQMMTFGKNLDTDYDALHETIDSVNITRSRIWVKVKIEGEWKELEKNINLK
jgi:hypothetical protein